MFEQLGRLLIIIGAAALVVGSILWLGGKLGLGSLPGDLRFSGDGWGCFIPVASCVVISIVLTFLLNIILRWLGK